MPGQISIAKRPSGIFGVDCRMCAAEGKPKETGLETWDSDEADSLANQHEEQNHPEAHALAQTSP